MAIDPKTKNAPLEFRRRGLHRQPRRLHARRAHLLLRPGKSLGCLDAKEGKVLWKNSDANLLEAIGPRRPGPALRSGLCNDRLHQVQRRRNLLRRTATAPLVAASTHDGRLLWQKDHGNYQLVLRDDALYAVGPQLRRNDVPNSGFKFDYATGKVLGEMPMRRACTRATGTLDSIFYRANGGTVRLVTATDSVHHIAPMRPACQDGVIVSDGHIYWGPWMCGCQLSLYGHICLAPAGNFNFRPGLDDSRLKTHATGAVKPLGVRPGDWPAYQGDNTRTCMTEAPLPEKAKQAWRFRVPSGTSPTAPVSAGGLVFFGDRSGAVTAVRADDGEVAWRAHTNGAVYFPPAVEDGRLFAGSADGRVYAFEAATGKPLWTFRVAPIERRIPVYGTLISTWPVAGGVVVEDGTVYAAAGIAHYDGTHVVALNAADGKPRWCNDSSGTVSEKMDHGVSLQGSLAIHDGELQFVGGGVHEIARYDLKTGRCLNDPFDMPRSNYHTAFSAYYPEYGRYMSLNCILPDRRWLVYDITYEGTPRANLALLPPLPEGQYRAIRPVSRWNVPNLRRGKERVWELKGNYRFSGFLVGKDVVIVAGHPGLDAKESSAIAAIALETGKPLWRIPLSAPLVKGGLATDAAGRVFASLENGEVACWEAE